MKLRTIAIVASFAVFPLAAGLLIVPPIARAENPDCVVTASDTDQITAASLQGLPQELAARKALLTRVITCAKADAQTLQTTLQNTSVSDDAKILRSQLSDKLGDATNYYDIESGKVSDAGIAGTRAIASEILSWRKANYDPLNEQVANFIIWSENQTLFDVAESRLSQMGKIVSFLESAGVNSNLESAFSNAHALVQSANDENQSAKNALVQFLPPDQSLTLIKQSLQSLSAAYEKFFEISTIIQTLLPTGSK